MKRRQGDVVAVQGDEFSELKIPYNTGTRIENSRRSGIMSGVKIWEENVVIPTYGIGAADKNPMFWRAVFIREVPAGSIRTQRSKRFMMRKKIRRTMPSGWKMNI